ncbi:glycosyltransferase [Halobacteriales archaeon Cl-PHB]
MRVLNLVTTRKPFFEQQEQVLRDQGVDVTTVTVPGTWDPEDGTTRSPLDYVRFCKTVFDASPREYDVVHANYGLTAPAALAVPGPPVVVSLWGSDVFGRFGRVSQVCARLADAVVVMSPEMAEAVEADSYVLPHGIDLSRFEPMATGAARAELGWDPDAHQVLFPYSPSREEKDYPRAERVVAAVDDRRDAPVRLQVVTGVAHDRVPIYMNAADAMVLTSTHEGSPNAVREALACNLPVVATDVGDVARRVADASLSTVADTDAALADGLERALTSVVAPDGREAVRAESLDRMGQRLRRIYRTATADEPPTAAAPAEDAVPLGADPDSGD